MNLYIQFINLKGKFLLSKTVATGNSYNATVKIKNSIKISHRGLYVFDFYTFIKCPKIDCLGDYIELGFKYLDEIDYTIVYRSNNTRNNDSFWVQELVKVKLDPGDINVKKTI
jgi:hypothetical protein